MKVWLPLWFTSCLASAPSGREQDTRFVFEGQRVESRRVQSLAYAHRVFEKHDCVANGSAFVSVFLDGDGASWLARGRASEDPTPGDPIALRLLAADPDCGVYVSRPCTFGLVASDPRCEPAVWTVDRYAEPVIADLAALIEAIVPAQKSIRLVGYSGGGLLASHLAKRLPRVRELITLGANLDPAAWLHHHGFTPVVAARTPASPFPLPGRVRQLHVFGAADDVSPHALAAAVLARDDGARVLVLEGADHTCCWVREWPRVRARFQQRTESSDRSRSSSSRR